MPWINPDLVKIRSERLETAQRVADEGGTLKELAAALGVTIPALYEGVFMWRPDLQETFRKNAERRRVDRQKDRMVLISLVCLNVLTYREVAEIEGVSVPAIVNARNRACGWKPLEWLEKHFGPELPSRLARMARKYPRNDRYQQTTYMRLQCPQYYLPEPYGIDVDPARIPAYISGTSET